MRAKKHLRAKPGTASPVPLAKRWKGAWLWGLAVGFIAVPLAWWLIQTPTRRAILFATCEELALSSSSSFSMVTSGVTKVSSYGLTARLDNPSQFKMQDKDTGQSVDLVSQTISLEDSGSITPPAISVALTGHTGPFITAFLAAPAVARLRELGSSESEQDLEIQAPRMSAQLQADGLLVAADRITLPQSPAHHSVLITAENKETMATIRLQTLSGHESVLSASIPKDIPIELRMLDNTTLISDLKDCHKVDLLLGDDKITLPSMDLDLHIRWMDTSFKYLKIEGGTKAPESPLSMQETGHLKSLIYNDRELNDTNLAHFSALPLEKQGLLGLLLLIVLWATRQVGERASKLVIDKILPERKP
jgi:hypothetical protein